MLSGSEKFRFIVDFTWDGKKLCLLEMGEFHKSALTGLDFLRQEKGEMTAVKSEYEAELKKEYPEAIYIKDTSIGGFISANTLEIYDFKNDKSGFYNFDDFSLLPQLVAARSQMAGYAWMRDMIVSYSVTIPTIQE